MKLPSNFQLLFSAEELDRAIDRVAVRLNIELRDTKPVFVCVMKGGLPFTWDLMRRTNLDIEMDFIRAQRYTEREGGELVVERDVGIDLAGKTVVLIDDILDRGVTISYLRQEYQKVAERVYSCVLVDKKTTRDCPIEADFVAVTCPDVYIVGRGMDYEGRYRQLPAIYTWKEEN